MVFFLIRISHSNLFNSGYDKIISSSLSLAFEEKNQIITQKKKTTPKIFVQSFFSKMNLTCPLYKVITHVPII